MRDDDSDDDASGGNEGEEEGEEEGSSGSDEEAREADGQEGAASHAWDMPEVQDAEYAEGVQQEGSILQNPGIPGPAGPPLPSGSHAESRRVVQPAGGGHPQGFSQGLQQSIDQIQQEPLGEPGGGGGGWGAAAPVSQLGEAGRGCSSSIRGSGVHRGGGVRTSGGRPAPSGVMVMASGSSTQSRGHVQFLQGVF